MEVEFKKPYYEKCKCCEYWVKFFSTNYKGCQPIDCVGELSEKLCCFKEIKRVEQ